MSAWLDFTLGLIERIPLERLIVKPLDRAKDRDDLRKLAMEIAAKPPTAPAPSPNNVPMLEAGAVKTSKIVLASTQETLEELKRRLGKELYKLELDLQGGLRIAGKPCDCATKKHNFGIEATAEELMSYEHNPAYGEVIAWYQQHLPEFYPEEIVHHDQEYYRAMTPTLREFRKRIMGTEHPLALLNKEERQKLLSKVAGD